MTWVRIDDLFPDHPKVIGLSDAAFRLFISGLCYANRYLTDGVVPLSISNRYGNSSSADELVEAGLWEADDSGYVIRSYDEYQPTKDKIEQKREATRKRVAHARRVRKEYADGNAVTDALHDEMYAAGNADVPSAPNPNPNPNTSTEVEVAFTNSVRNKSAQQAVMEIGSKLAEARANGINAWNLSLLVEDQWDALHAANDIGGCIALTVWYVAELQSRPLSTPEISRIGQMTKRFGRIALLAIDEAASKDLQDLVSYAFRIAQAKYRDHSMKG